MTRALPRNLPSLEAPPGIKTIPFSRLRSANTAPGFTANERIDPYFHGLWADGAQASWMSRKLLDRLHSAKLAKISRGEAKASAKSSLAALLRSRRQAHLAELAAVGMWRTLSGQQLAAITGHPAAAINPQEMSWPFRAGLVDRGSLLPDLHAGLVKNEHHLYRPVDTPTFADLLAQLTFPERCALTAGQPWTRGSQNDRHNMLATEIGLRVAEYCDIGTVLGEKLSRSGMLTKNDTGPGGTSADLTIVREDGHRIAVEITASGTQSLGGKVRRWAKTLASTDQTKVGLSVVFLEAAGPERPDHISTALWNSIRAEVAVAAYENGGARAGVPERMAIARWRWFFPKPGCTSTAFQVLECLRPTGEWNNRWEVVALLDPTDLIFEPADPHAAAALIRNSWDLGGLPHWLKPAGHTTDFSAALIRRAGLANFPTIAPTRRT